MSVYFQLQGDERLSRSLPALMKRIKYLDKAGEFVGEPQALEYGALRPLNEEEEHELRELFV